MNEILMQMVESILTFTTFLCMVMCVALLVRRMLITSKCRHMSEPKQEVPATDRENAVEYSRIIRTFHLSGAVAGTRNRKFLNWLEYSLKPGRHDRLKAYAYDMLVSPTCAEKEFYSYLRSRGIRFIPQCICVADRAYILDCYLPDRHMAVEIDGGYHLENRQKEKDSERDRKIRKRYGIMTVRFTNNEVLSGFFRGRFDEIYGETYGFGKNVKSDRI